MKGNCIQGSPLPDQVRVSAKPAILSPEGFKVDSPIQKNIREGSIHPSNQFMNQLMDLSNISWLQGLIVPQLYEDCNDDVHLEHFQGLPDQFAGFQRLGLANQISQTSSPILHMEEAINMPFPLSRPTPLPGGIERAIKRLSSADIYQVRIAWKSQIRLLRSAASSLEETRILWDSAIPRELRGGAGKLNLPLFCKLMESSGIGGKRWISQFTFGFPLTGVLSQKYAYPLDDSIDPLLPSEAEVAKLARPRFLKRIKGGGNISAEVMWDEALEQVKKGWLSEPRPLCLEDYASESLVPPAFRFGVKQGVKIRACDDLKDSGVNQLVSVISPIKIPGWDHVVSMCDLVRHSNIPWHFGKFDHESAYKFLPVKSTHLRKSRILLRDPRSSQLYLFISKVLPFGASAAVLHYNIFARILSQLITLIFGIPVINYFDDFGFLVPADLSSEAVICFTVLCQLLCIQLKWEKSDHGSRIGFLGLRGVFPAPWNDMNLTVYLDIDKRHKWSKLIANHLIKHEISSDDLESLVGKLSFAQSHLFGKFARAMLRELYKKLNRKRYIPKLSMEEYQVLKWWYLFLGEVNPRIARKPPDKSEFILYTDARGVPPRIAAVLISSELYLSSKKLLFCLTSNVQTEILQLFNDTLPIYALETIAAVGAITSLRYYLKNSSVTLYVDNQATVSALIKSSSVHDLLALLIKLMWAVVARESINLWIEWVPTKANLADNPSREASTPFPILREMEFSDLHNLIHTAKEFDNKWPPKLNPLVPRNRVMPN